MPHCLLVSQIIFCRTRQQQQFFMALDILYELLKQNISPAHARTEMDEIKAYVCYILLMYIPVHVHDKTNV